MGLEIVKVTPPTYIGPMLAGVNFLCDFFITEALKRCHIAGSGLYVALKYIQNQMVSTKSETGPETFQPTYPYPS